MRNQWDQIDISGKRASLHMFCSRINMIQDKIIPFTYTNISDEKVYKVKHVYTEIFKILY